MKTSESIIVGTVPYLNVEPLVWALELAGDEVQLVSGTPRELAGLMDQGDVEVGLVPVAEVVRTGRWTVVPGVSIACEGPVRSVILVSKVAPSQIRSVLLDRSSMTSILLGQVILRDQYGAAPSTDLSDRSLTANHDFENDPHDAFIVIGNEALKITPDRLPCYLDLGKAWKELTGLPFVFAVWALSDHDSRRASLHPTATSPTEERRCDRIARVLTEAAVRGLQNLDSVCESGSIKHDLPIDLVRSYLIESIRYGLGPHEQKAIEEFSRRLKKHRLLETDHPLAILESRYMRNGTTR